MMINSSYVAIDFETHLISEAAPAPKPVCLSYFDGNQKGLLDIASMEAFLLSLLRSRAIIIAHNMKFEFGVIYHHFPQLRSLLYRKQVRQELLCTKIVEKLHNNVAERPLYKFSLADLVLTHFDTDLDSVKHGEDAWRLRYNELEDVPIDQWPEAAKDYAIEDSVWAYRLWDEVQKQYQVDYHLSVAAECNLSIIGAYGIKIAKDRVQLLEQEIASILAPSYKYLKEQGFYDKTKKMKRFREHVAKVIPKIKKTAKGAVATDFEAMDYYLSQVEDPVIQAFKDIGEFEKVKTAFISNLKEAKDVIRTEYNAVVSTGRTSSHKSSFYSSVNIQQMPRKVDRVTWDVRNCFIPRDGFKLVSIDYSGLELASTAHQLFTVYGESRLRETLNSGNVPTDLHSNLAARIMSLDKKRKITYDEFVAHKKDAEYKNYRQLAKPINLGFPGGIGYDTMRTLLARDKIFPKYASIAESRFENQLVYILQQLKEEFPYIRIKRTEFRKYELIYDDLIRIKRELFNLYPELDEFLNKGHKDFLTGAEKSVKNEWGEWEQEPMYRYDIYGFQRDWCTYTAFCNGFLMQTPSAIGAKTVVNDIMQAYHDDPQVRPLAFIHDELLFEVIDTDEKYDIIENIARKMISGMQKVLSSVRIAVEASVMDYWSKSDSSWDKQFWS